MKASWNAHNHTNARFKRCWHRHAVIKDSFMLYKWPQTNTLSLIDSSINWLREGTLAPLQQEIFYSQPWQYNTDCTTLSTVLLLQKKDPSQQPSEGKCLTSKFSSAFACLWSDSVWLLHRSCGCTSYSLPGSPSAAWIQRGTQTEGFSMNHQIRALFFPVQSVNELKVIQLAEQSLTCVRGQMRLTWVCVTQISSSISSVFSSAFWFPENTDQWASTSAGECSKAKLLWFSCPKVSPSFSAWPLPRLEELWMPSLKATTLGWFCRSASDSLDILSLNSSFALVDKLTIDSRFCEEIYASRTMLVWSI